MSFWRRQYDDIRKEQEVIRQRLEGLAEQVFRLEEKYKHLVQQIERIEKHQERDFRHILGEAEHLRSFSNELLINLSDLIQFAKQKANSLPPPTVPPPKPTSQLLNMVMNAARMTAVSRFNEEEIQEIAKLTDEERKVLFSNIKELQEEEEKEN